MKPLKLFLFSSLFLVLPNTLLAHYEVKNPQTSLSELSFDLIHTYWDGTNNPPTAGDKISHMNHINRCKRAPNTVSLNTCVLRYRFSMLNSSGGILSPDIQTYDVDLRGNGSYDDELMDAATHYDAVKVAIAHGVAVDQHISIPRTNITSLAGSSGKFRVSTYGVGSICSSSTSCSTPTPDSYTTSTLDLVQQNLDVACEAKAEGATSIENILSGEHIYLYNSNASRRSENIGAINLSVNCVNWLPTAKSKTLKFTISPNVVVATGSNTEVTCGAYVNDTSTTQPGYTFSKNISVPGYESMIVEYDTDPIYYGLYVSTPSTTAETSLALNCDLSGGYTLN
ncbi:heme utilization protein [Yersinia kristensenii]|uniref:heme utilization protein n=1 Tax=Yersinia kristensenii TaxID=28152 RepID=UPI0011A1A768|nr:heme utilization protein [Yersinia kristensenii]